MESDIDYNQRLLDDGEEEKDESRVTRSTLRTQLLSLPFILLSSLMSISILLNIIFFFYLIPGSRSGGEEKTSFSTLSGQSSYTGLALDTPKVHLHHTHFWDTNTTISDELWESIDTNPMAVALTDSYADAHGLPRSERFPWDHGKGRYFIKVFHQLHCLKFIRRAFVDYERGNPPKLNGRHVHHCLDSLRQDIQCISDDTPMPAGEEARAIGDNQRVMCRNFDKLVEWVYAPERNACHRALDDYRPITHSIERYAFCEKDSQYFEVMTNYFREHGHSDPWS